MNLDAIRKAYQDVGSGDMEAILALCHDDVEWVVNGPGLAQNGAYQGVQGVRDVLGKANEAWSLRFAAPREFIDAGDTVVVLGEQEGKVKETGETYKNRWVHVFTMKDGRISSFRNFICHWAGDLDLPPITWQS